MKNNDRKYISLLSLLPLLIAGVPAFRRVTGPWRILKVMVSHGIEYLCDCAGGRGPGC